MATEIKPINPKSVRLINGWSPSESARWFSLLFAVAAMWKDPDSKKRKRKTPAPHTKQLQEEFEEYVQKKELMHIVYVWRALCLQHGIELCDKVIDCSSTDFLTIQNGKPLTKKARARLYWCHRKVNCIRIRLQAEEYVIFQDGFEPYVGGRWSAEPVEWSPNMNQTDCADLFGVEQRQLKKHLEARGARFKVLNQQSIIVAVSDLPKQKPK